ncbi:MAG: pyridoxamine 5'-phosphate oxidase family protein [Thermoplasmatales archaeon]|nr:pyridoxamine 5'-phosphate oxidase family protein [Thermoplasmatales archaeon]
MVKIPARVLDLISRPESSKILCSVDSEGQPHSIVCGSVFAIDEETLAAGEVLMKRTKANMAGNKKVAIMVVSGKDAYNIDCVVDSRLDSGPVLDGLNVKLDKMNLKAHAVWTFKASAVYDQGANPNAGKRIA